MTTLDTLMKVEFPSSDELIQLGVQMILENAYGDITLVMKNDRVFTYIDNAGSYAIEVANRHSHVAYKHYAINKEELDT